MAGNDVNLFDFTYAINAIKKKDLVDYIEKMKGKVVADKQIQNLCSEIVNLSENVKSLVNTNERLTSELMVVKNVNNILENRIVKLEKQLSKNEQYGCWNNVKISGVSNEISDQDFEKNIIKICKDLDINISHMRKKHKNLQRLGYQYITYGYGTLSQASSRKKHTQHNKKSYCEIC